MLLNEQQKKLQEDISDLRGKNRELEKLVDMSCVDAVKAAEKKVKKAESDKDTAIEKASKEEKKTKAEANEVKRKAEESKEKSLERQYISYGLVAAILLISTSDHPGVWVDLIHWFSDPLSLAGTAWMGYLHPVSEITSFERWAGLIIIPVIVIGAGVLLFLLGRWYKRRSNLLTVVFLVLVLAITIICGDGLPFNRFIGSLGLMTAYVVFCEWADRKWSDYPDADRWKHLQKSLVWE